MVVGEKVGVEDAVVWVSDKCVLGGRRRRWDESLGETHGSWMKDAMNAVEN